MKKYLFAAVLALLAVPAMGQVSLQLDIRDGLVHLDATSVPARQILAEWARIGGTKVVGAEKMSGAPLTLKLEGVPESQALDIILRNVAGYMAAPRRAAAEPGVSAYDRIVILPTSAAPAASTANNGRATTPAAMAGGERRLPPRPPGMPDPSVEPEFQPEPEVADTNGFQQQPPPVFTFPQPQAPGPGNGNSVFVPVQQGGFGVPMQGQQPQITLQPDANGQPTIYNFLPPGTQPPANGFGVIGAPTPGMVQQPAPAPGQQVPPQRPPGG